MTFWDDNATPAGVFNVGDMYNEYTQRQAAFIVEQLGVEDGLLLDLGCGIGRLSRPIANALPRVTVWGHDTSETMVRKAQDDTPGGHAFYVPLLFPLRTYFGFDELDGAWCVLTFQHLPDDIVQQHLADLFEILKPGARLVTQWVTSGEEAPMSYPRCWIDIFDFHRDAGFYVPTYAIDEYVTQYTDDWIWVVAEKPA